MSKLFLKNCQIILRKAAAGQRLIDGTIFGASASDHNYCKYRDQKSISQKKKV